MSQSISYPQSGVSVRAGEQPHWLRSLLAYALTVVLCLIFLFRVMRLWEADLGVPFVYAGDTLVNCLWIKSIVENGWYLDNPAVGAPLGLEYHDFPVTDTFHLLAIKALAAFTRNYGLILNLYFLLSFPLTAVSALFVFRRFGLSRPCAIVGSLLFTFLPAHWMRGVDHLFLATYYQIPLAALVMLWLGCRDRALIDFRRVPGSPEGDRPRVRFLAAVAICVLVSLTGVYYALFACFFFLVAGAYASLHRRRLSPLVVAGALAALTVTGAFATTLPSLLYSRAHGKNPEAAVRTHYEAELYGLKIAQLVLPITPHRLPAFVRVKQTYNGAPLVNENDMSALGLVGALGFLVLLICPFLPDRDRLPTGLNRLAVLNLAGVLLATVGGFSSLVALFLSPQLRAYNRISVYLGFFALFAVVSCLDRGYRRVAGRPRARGAFCGLLAVLLALGVWDQTNGWTYADSIARYRRDERFVRAIEAALPPGSMIFQLPYMIFPEGRPPHRMAHYDHLRGYLHSRSLRWSYPTMRGRLGDRRLRALAAVPLPKMLRALSREGFRGIYVSRDGYADGAASLEAGLCRLLGERPIRSEDGRLLFFRIGERYQRKERG